MSIWPSIRWRLNLVYQWFKASPDTVWEADPADFIFISADANKTSVLGGKYVDRILDPLQDLFSQAGYRCISVARPGSRITGQLRANFVYSLNRKALLRQFLSSWWIPLMKCGLKDLSAADPEGSRVYESMIRLVRPRVVFALNASAGLCQAGLRTNTPIIEVLHARGYGSPYNERWANQVDMNLPHGILAYDDDSARAFASRLPVLRIPNYRIKAELDFAKEFSRDHPGPTSLLTNSISRRILFTASYAYWNVGWTAGPPAELMRVIEKNPSFFLMVRAHPVMRAEPGFAETIKTLQSETERLPNADFTWSTNAPMYSVLEKTDVHITWNSLSAYEAADLGIPTFFLEFGRPILDTAMVDLQQKGYVAKLNPQEDELEKAILASTKSKCPPAEDEALDIQKIVQFAEKALEHRISSAAGDSHTNSVASHQ